MFSGFVPIKNWELIHTSKMMSYKGHRVFNGACGFKIAHCKIRIILMYIV